EQPRPAYQVGDPIPMSLVAPTGRLEMAALDARAHAMTPLAGQRWIADSARAAISELRQDQGEEALCIAASKLGVNYPAGGVAIEPRTWAAAVWDAARKRLRLGPAVEVSEEVAP